MDVSGSRMVLRVVHPDGHSFAASATLQLLACVDIRWTDWDHNAGVVSLSLLSLRKDSLLCPVRTDIPIPDLTPSPQVWRTTPDCAFLIHTRTHAHTHTRTHAHTHTRTHCVTTRTIPVSPPSAL